MSMDFDFSEVQRLSASLGRASTGLVQASRGVVTKGLGNVQRDTKRNISSHPSWRRLSPAVTFEQVGLSGEVGYEDRGQGELAGIAEFGSARHAPHPALIPAAKAEEPRFEKAMLDAAAKLVEDAL